MTENLIPSELVWDYGDNERLDDMRKLEVLQAVQRTASVPYSIRSKIITPILNKLIDEKVNDKDVTKAYEEESQRMNIEFGEI
jgi:hypothetical protein